jgi:hypothetical protein
LNGLQADKTRQLDRKDKTDLFEQLLSSLESDVNFQKKVLSKLNKYHKARLDKNLY